MNFSYIHVTIWITTYRKLRILGCSIKAYVIDVSVGDQPCEGGVTVQHVGGHCSLHHQVLT